MLEMTEQIQDPVLAHSPVSEIHEFVTPLQDESVLTDQIVQLWQVHGDYQTSMKHETEKFRALRNELGKLLHQMKELLARPGRNGQWSGWLKERAIPRATADRLVQKHERSLSPHTNCLTESISEPTEDEIEKLFAKVFPKLRRVLRTSQSVYRFVDLLTLSCDGTGRRVTEEGILVVKPVQLTEPVEFSGTESVVEPLSPISDVMAEADQEPM
jgi:hypothetical protein